MAVPKVEQAPQPSGNNVRWVLSEPQLSSLNFPHPTVENNRHLLAQTEGGEVAVEVFALPPTEPAASGFWTGIAQKIRSHLSPDEKLPATRLRIEPPIDFSDAQRGLHTPLSALYPYVVMEDGTRYGIGVFVPREWVGTWSGLKERNENGGLFGLGIRGNQVTEEYRQKEGIAFLIRLNGDTPLVEKQRDLGIKGFEPSRQEMLIGIPEPKDANSPHVSTIASHRQVVYTKGSSTPDLGEKQTDQADVSDLEFHIVAERGTEENATLDNRGLVEVIVVRCVEDEVVGKITKPSIVSDYPFDSSPTRSLRSVSGGGDLKGLQYSGIPDSTLKGETRFANERREEALVQSVRDIKPVARFKLALVGSGGPIRSSMTEAPELTLQQ